MIRPVGTGLNTDASGDGLAERIGLSALSGRIAAELEHMTGLVTGVQIAFSPPLQRGGTGPVDLAGPQAIDCLTQLLADLSRVMSLVADAAPPTASLAVADIREAIALRGLLQRMIAPALACETAGPVWPSGEVQWL